MLASKSPSRGPEHNNGTHQPVLNGSVIAPREARLLLANTGFTGAPAWTTAPPPEHEPPQTSFAWLGTGVQPDGTQRSESAVVQAIPYLIEPTVRPSMKDRWNARKITITGNTTSADAAISRLNCTSCWERKKVNPMDSVYLLSSCR